MKHLFWVILFCNLGSSLFANPPEVVKEHIYNDARYSRIFVGGQAYYYNLRISDSDSNSATATPNPFKGCLGGFILGYEYKRPNNLYAVLQLSYALGTIRTHDTGNNRRFIHDEILETRFGYFRSLTKNFRYFLTPYTGAGFRWNIQHRSAGTLAALNFDYYKIYIPLGLIMNYVPNKIVNLGVDFEWMPDVLSMVSISTLKGAFWELKRMNNYLVQAPCLFTFGNRWELGFTPFWMQFGDGQSIAVTDNGIALDLDQQKTNDWGGRVSLGVHF